MKKIALFAAVFWFAAVFSAQADGSGSDGFCSDSWPYDDQMMGYCREKQDQSYEELFSLAEKYQLLKDGTLNVSPTGGQFERIFHFCMQRWEMPQYDSYDFANAVYCIKKQIEALKKPEN